MKQQTETQQEQEQDIMDLFADETPMKLVIDIQTHDYVQAYPILWYYDKCYGTAHIIGVSPHVRYYVDTTSSNYHPFGVGFIYEEDKKLLEGVQLQTYPLYTPEEQQMENV